MNVVKVNIEAGIFRAWVRGFQEGASLKGSHDELRHHLMMNHASEGERSGRTKLSLIGASGQAKPLVAKTPGTGQQEQFADKLRQLGRGLASRLKG